MSGFFGVASQNDCVMDLFFGVDYHSHLGTRRGGMAVYGKEGFNTFDPEPGVSDPEEEPVKIGKPLLVPPIDRLGVIIYYRFLTANPEDKIPSGSIFIANYSNLRLSSLPALPLPLRTLTTTPSLTSP